MTNVSPQDLREKLSTPSPDVICVDVRTGEEHEEMRIPGVVNIPMSELHEHIDDLKWHKEVYVHCASGGRSAMACSALTKAGLTNVCNVEGGITAWREQGLLTVCKRDGSRAQMPIMRQVMIAAGSLIVLGMLASITLYPLFVMLAWFVGLGLIYGGASGNCMMAKLLAKMPWNKECK